MLGHPPSHFHQTSHLYTSQDKEVTKRNVTQLGKEETYSVFTGMWLHIPTILLRQISDNQCLSSARSRGKNNTRKHTVFLWTSNERSEYRFLETSTIDNSTKTKMKYSGILGGVTGALENRVVKESMGEKLRNNSRNFSKYNANYKPTDSRRSMTPKHKKGEKKRHPGKS